ncbi:MAG: sortase, partial [Anaerolineae bacterium]|nr:sortase [Anaerolineae bacterium]
VSVEAAVISDFVWGDVNGDGAQAGESGLDGVRVYIDSNGNNVYDVGEPTDVTDGSGNYSIGNLAAGTYDVRIDTSPLPAGYVPTFDLDGTGTAHEASVTVTAGQTRTDVDFGYQAEDAKIQITKTLPTVTFDSPQLIRFTYLLIVENTGNATLTSLQVTDNLATAFATPTSFSIISVLSSDFSINSSFNGDTNINLLTGTDTLAAGADGTITLVVLVDTGGSPITYINTATTEATPPVGSQVSASDSVSAPAFIDPAVTKAVDPASAGVGDQITFTITVFNNGTNPATNVIVTDTLPDTLDYISHTTTGPAATVDTVVVRTITVTIATLGVSDVYTIIIVAEVNSLGIPPIQNSVLVTADAGVGGNLTVNDSAVAAINEPAGTESDPDSLPATGFAPGRVSLIQKQPLDKAYTALGDVWLEIPSLGVKTSIVGVPRFAGSWDVDWLWEQAGWLQGTAFPSWQGNSVVTAHVYLPNGKPGPFVNLDKLRWGTQVIVHAFGQRYVYEVRTIHIVLPNDLSVLKHEDRAWLTLLTCKGYSEDNDSYKYRIATRAVLIKVEAER